MPFFHAAPITKPIHVKPFLGKPDLHWKPGFSAYELATSWIGAGGIPDTVRYVLDQVDEHRGAQLVEGLFEHETEMPGRGRPSQTDLLALIKSDHGYAVLGVEGKVDELFGPLVSEWFDGSSNRADRLNGICSELGLDPNCVGHLRYQLLHWTCACLREADRYQAEHALMLVHSFSRAHASMSDFERFALAMGCEGAGVGTISSPSKQVDRKLRLGWVADQPA